MQCHICYKAIEQGNKEAGYLQSGCGLFMANQCPAFSFYARKDAGDTKVPLSPILKWTPPILLILFAAIIYLSLVYYPEFYLVRYEYSASKRPEIYGMTNRELILRYNNTGDFLIAAEILNRAVTVPLEELPSLIQQNQDILIRLQGYVTSVHTDFLFGSYITIGNTKTRSVSDIRIHTDNTYARTGDEVIIFLIPVFLGHDTPIQSWEWAQVTRQTHSVCRALKSKTGICSGTACKN